MPNHANPSPPGEGFILAAEIAASHGVRGLVKLRLHVSDPELIAGNILQTDRGPLRVTPQSSAGNGVYLARVEGVNDRTQADTYRHLKLYLPRAALPETATDEHYHADLIGMNVMYGADTLGKVTAVHNYGASDLIDVKPARGGTTVLLPFAPPYLDNVDHTARAIRMHADALEFFTLTDKRD